MKEFTAHTSIRATPEIVWSILTQASDYYRWNPEIPRIEGRIALGEKIKAYVNLGKGVTRAVGVSVTELQPLRRMVWTGGLPFGLFTGRRIFILAPRQDGIVEFILHVEFRGPLSNLIARSLGDRQPDIDALAAGLKAQAEGL